jgi:hypothetical protein
LEQDPEIEQFRAQVRAFIDTHHERLAAALISAGT